LDALNAAGLALCHTDDDNGAGSNIFGAYATNSHYPHHKPVPYQSGNTPKVSCNTTNQPNTGTIEIDQYHSGATASSALQQFGENGTWLIGWHYGNVTVEVTQSTPPAVSQQIAQVVDHLPGSLRAFGNP
jgi:hypothetical protein